jgi:hypothetical protein
MCVPIVEASHESLVVYFEQACNMKVTPLEQNGN